MSTSGTCTLFEVENIHAPCPPEPQVVEVLDSSFYGHTVPIPETYAFNFPSQYVEPPVPLDFPPLPTYFIPEHENVPKSQRGSPLIGLQIPTFPQHESNIPNRPRSSPSTFGPNTEPLIDWPSRPLPPPGSDDEESPSTLHQPTTPRPTPPTPTPRHRASSSISTLSELHNQRTGRQYAPIAPNPAGLRQLQQAHAQAQALKRAASEDEWESPSSKKKRSNPPSPQVEITEEDEFLLKLKDEEENLSWKEIVARFQTKFGKAYQVPALQMRHKRLRDRMRVWTDNDIAALKMAHEDWLSQRFNIIASKMADNGATEKWAPRQCAQKWDEITGGGLFNPMMRTPIFTPSYTTSPVEAPLGGFIPPFPPIGTPFTDNRPFKASSA